RFVEANRGDRAQRRERQRQAGHGRQVAHGVGLAPILGERNVGVRDGFADAHHLTEPSSEPARTRLAKHSMAALRQAAKIGAESPSHSAITAPPPPAPVSFAPSAPASRASAQQRSMPSVDTNMPESNIWL